MNSESNFSSENIKITLRYYKINSEITLKYIKYESTLKLYLAQQKSFQSMIMFPMT